MALRLRRGTDAERQLITPLEGELIWTTDTKELYAGDGSTAGGIKITGADDAPRTELNELDDVTLGTINDGDVLAYDNTLGVWTAVAPQAPELVSGQNYNIGILGDDSSILVNTTNNFFTGNLDGDIYDSTGLRLWDSDGGIVYAKDGATFIDLNQKGIEADLRGNVQGSVFNSDLTQILVDHDNERFYGTLEGVVIGDLTGSVFTDNSNLMVDAINQEFYGLLNGNVRGDLLGNVTGNVVGNLSGDVQGNVIAPDSSVILNGVNGTLTTRQIISNGTLDISCETIFVESTGPQVLQATGLAKPNAQGPSIAVRSSNGTLEAPTAVVGGTTGDAFFDIQGYGYDGTNYQLSAGIKLATGLDSTVSTGIVPGRIVMFTYNDSGTFTLSNLLIWNQQGRLGLGINRPTEKLHVANGNAKIDGFVQFGSLTDAERNALTAANGMVIYNTTNNRFEGYQNGSWINLDDGSPAAGTGA